jgi:hypothetical protein
MRFFKSSYLGVAGLIGVTLLLMLAQDDGKGKAAQALDFRLSLLRWLL